MLTSRFMFVAAASLAFCGTGNAEPRGQAALNNGDLLEIRSSNLLPDEAISGLFQINGEGKVVLGPMYGSVRIAGLTADEAAATIVSALKRFVKEPQVSMDQVSGEHLLQAQAVLRGLGPGGAASGGALLSSDGGFARSTRTAAPRVHQIIANGDVLEIRVPQRLTLSDEPIGGLFRVNSDGAVVLGPAYGTVRVAGLNRDQAVAAVKKHLRQIIREPEVSLEYVGDDPLLEQQAMMRAFGIQSSRALVKSR